MKISDIDIRGWTPVVGGIYLDQIGDTDGYYRVITKVYQFRTGINTWKPYIRWVRPRHSIYLANDGECNVSTFRRACGRRRPVNIRAFYKWMPQEVFDMYMSVRISPRSEIGDNLCVLGDCMLENGISRGDSVGDLGRKASTWFTDERYDKYTHVFTMIGPRYSGIPGLDGVGQIMTYLTHPELAFKE